MPRITNIPERFAVEQLCRTGAVFPPAGSGMKPGPHAAIRLRRRRTGSAGLNLALSGSGAHFNDEMSCPRDFRFPWRGPPQPPFPAVFPGKLIKFF